MSLTVKIKGDASHFEKTMAKVRASGERVGKVFSTIGKGAAYTATGLLAAGAGAAYFGTSLAKMAEDGDAANKRLENIVESMGLFGNQSGKVAGRLGDLADEMGRTFGVDDDSVLNVQSKLSTFKELAKTADKVGGAFDRTTSAAFDLAAAGFGTAEANAVQLGKALQDPVKGLTALARAGVTFTQGERDRISSLVASNKMLEAQSMVLSAIEKQVGGTAAATAKGTARMTVAFSQLAEKAGGPLASGFAGFAEGFAAQMPAILKNAETLGAQLGPRFASMGETGGKLLSTGLAEAITGDLTIFEKMGNVVGEAILSGAQAVIGGAVINKLARPVMEYMEGANMDTPEAKAKARATVNGYLGEQMTTGQLFSASPDMNAAIEDLRMEIRALNSGGNINAYKQSLEEIKRIRQLAEQGLFNKDTLKTSR